MSIIPLSHMPAAPMKRIIVHWTAGGHIASSLDREHYHFLVEGDLDVVRGHLPITANVPPLRSGKYAAHTRGCNSYSIGLAACGMAGAVENPFKSGRAPISEAQFERLAEVAACLAERYKIPVTNKTILSHAEVQPNLGIRQSGKWDISRLAFDLDTRGPKAVGDKFRALVKAGM